MQVFDINVDGWEGTVTISRNTLTLTVPGWYRPTTEITPELPEEMRLAASIGTLEEFSRRPGFKIEAGELPYLDEDGEEFDLEEIIKLYDDVHGGGGCGVSSAEILFGACLGGGRRSFQTERSFAKGGLTQPLSRPYASDVKAGKHE